MMAESLPDQAHESVQQGSAEWETVAAQDRRSRYAVAAPEVIHDSEEKIVDYSKSLDVPEVAQIETPLYFVRHNDDPNNGLEVTPSLEQPRHVRKILGLGPKTFWLLVIVAIVVIAAAIGGGVGGSIAVKNQRNASLTADAVGRYVVFVSRSIPLYHADSSLIQLPSDNYSVTHLLITHRRIRDNLVCKQYIYSRTHRLQHASLLRLQQDWPLPNN